MLNAEDSIRVSASPRDLYEFVVNPTNLPSLLRGDLVEIEEVLPLPGEGYTYRCVYRWAGFPIWAQAGTTQLIPNERIMIESNGGVESVLIWNFIPVDGGTEVGLSFAAQDESMLMRRVSAKVIQQELRRTVEVALGNVKVIAAALAPAKLSYLVSPQAQAVSL